MKPKTLRTNHDYRAALAQVESLMDQVPPDEAELERWSLLVEKYEEAHFPIAHPIAAKPSVSTRRRPE